MIKGLDLLCLSRKDFPIEDAISVFPKGWALGAFIDVFGLPFNNLEQFLKSGKVKLFRGQFHWDAAHEQLIPLKKLINYCFTMNELAKAFTATEFWISHTCEYVSNKKEAIERRISLIREYAPKCKIVQSCMDGYYSKKHPVEVHGDAHVWRPDFVSMDGVDIKKINVKRWLEGNKKAYAAFGWRSEFNLRRIGQSKPPLPKARPMILTKAHIQEVIALMK